MLEAEVLNALVSIKIQRPNLLLMSGSHLQATQSPPPVGSPSRSSLQEASGYQEIGEMSLPQARDWGPLSGARSSFPSDISPGTRSGSINKQQLHLKHSGPNISNPHNGVSIKSPRQALRVNTSAKFMNATWVGGTTFGSTAWVKLLVVLIWSHRVSGPF